MESIVNTSELQSHKFIGNGQDTSYLPVMVKEKDSKCVALFTERELERAMERANGYIGKQEYNHLFENYICECTKENTELSNANNTTIFSKISNWFNHD